MQSATYLLSAFEGPAERAMRRYKCVEHGCCEEWSFQTNQHSKFRASKTRIGISNPLFSCTKVLLTLYCSNIDTSPKMQFSAKIILLGLPVAINAWTLSTCAGTWDSDGNRGCTASACRTGTDLNWDNNWFSNCNLRVYSDKSCRNQIGFSNDDWDIQLSQNMGSFDVRQCWRTFMRSEDRWEPGGGLFNVNACWRLWRKCLEQATQHPRAMRPLTALKTLFCHRLLSIGSFQPQISLSELGRKFAKLFSSFKFQLYHILVISRDLLDRSSVRRSV